MFVRKSLQRAVFALMTTSLLLTACNMGATPAPTVDVNAINTAAVATAMGQLSAQFTQTALAAPSPTVMSTNTAVSLPTASGALPTTSGALPTISINATPIAGFTQVVASPAAPAGPTASLGDACNNSVYEADVTIPDGAVLKPGEDFIKTWAVRNTGTCTWDDGYTLAFIGGDQALDPVDVELSDADDFVAAGAAVNLSVPLTAPLAAGKYQGTWRMQSDSGNYFGTPLTVIIEVK
jgi:Ig-like domain from next to BRCA1 gene